MAVKTVKYELLGRRSELAGSGQGDFVTVHVAPLLLPPLPVPASHYTGSAAHDLQRVPTQNVQEWERACVVPTMGERACIVPTMHFRNELLNRVKVPP